MSEILDAGERIIIEVLQEGALLKVTNVEPVFAQLTDNAGDHTVAVGDVFSLETKKLIIRKTETSFQIDYELTDAGKVWPNDLPAPPVISIPTNPKTNRVGLAIGLAVLAILIFLFLRFVA